MTNEGAARRWWVIDPVARTSTSVDTPGDCRPQRWADADSVVATCSRRMASQLRLVHLDGTSSPLGIRHTERTRRLGAPIFNDEDVRTVRGTSWFESYGGCGGGVLTRQTPAGTARLVRVPGRDGALTLVGTRGDDLLVALQRTECGSSARPGRALDVRPGGPDGDRPDPARPHRVVGRGRLRHRGPLVDLVRAAALALATTTVTACSQAPSAPTAEPARAAAVTGRTTGPPTPVTATVDASLLGPGSTVAVVARRTSRDVDAGVVGTSLEVITPEGDRIPVYDVTLVDESGYYPGDFTLADWRPELHTALLRVARGDAVPDRVVSYDLTTGETHELVLPEKAISAGFEPRRHRCPDDPLRRGPAGPGRVANLGRRRRPGCRAPPAARRSRPSTAGPS